MSLFEQMTQQMDEGIQKNEFGIQKTGYQTDERFYIITKDSDGNGSVLVRFLPFWNEEDQKLVPYIQRQKHNFSINAGTDGRGDQKKRFLDEWCPKAIGRDCPICDHAWGEYNKVKESGNDVAKKAALARTSKDKFITNIQIIDDKLKPENNGKIFLFEFGPQLKKIIDKSMFPENDEYTSEEPNNPWNIMNGGNVLLKLVGKKQSSTGIPTWENSKVLPQSAYFEDEAEAKRVLGLTHDITEFEKESAYKTHDELVDRLNYVIYGKQTKKSDAVTPEKENSTPNIESVENEQPATSQRKEPEPIEGSTPPKTESEDDFFNQFK